MKKDIIWQEIDRISGHEKEEMGLEAYVSIAVRGGGEAYIRRDSIFIWMPWDPIGGDDMYTVYVMYVAGNLLVARVVLQELLLRGYKWIGWTPAYKQGNKDYRKYDLREWLRLMRATSKEKGE